MSKKNLWLLSFILFINICMGCKHEISWQELTSQNFIPRRSSIGNEQYEKQINDIKMRNLTYEDQILEDVFELDTDAKKNHVKESKTPRYKLVINSFPFWLEKDIVHLLMFTTTNNWDEKTLKQLTIKQIEEQAPDLLDTKLFEIHIHINNVGHRTVQKLSHTHVFVKSKNEEAIISDVIKNLPYSKP